MKTPTSRLRTLLSTVLLCCLPVACTQSDDLQKADAEMNRKFGVIEAQLREAITKAEEMTTELSTEIASLYPDLEARARVADASEYQLTASGVLYRKHAVKNGVPAVFVSGVIPVDDHIRTIVLGTEGMDPVLMKMAKSHSEVGQAYYNDRHSYNRIYPPFNVISQYPAGMDIPKYNFYYLADETHNPNRRTVWVKEPYVDPAGRGWMISCIAPVYHREVLEGVCGLDITIETLVRNLDLDQGNDLTMLMTSDGTVVATGESCARMFKLPLKAKHRYVDTIRSDTLRPENHNLLKSTSLEIRQSIRSVLDERGRIQSIRIDGMNLVMKGRYLEELDWWIVSATPRS
jgi:hypothetical protein